MSQFKITNLTNGTVSFAGGRALGPGESRPVDIVSLELKRLEQRQVVLITELPADPTLPADLTPDFEKPVSFTKEALLALLATDADVRAAVLAIATPPSAD